MQGATQKKLNVPSNDPVGSAKVLEIRTEEVINKQFEDNAHLAEAFLSNTDHILAELGDIVVRAKEIAINQSSGASSNEGSRLGVSEEVSQLYQQSIALANRRIGDRYLLAGYKVETAPVDEKGNYIGDRGKMMVEIGRDVYITMNLPGVEVFNTNPEASRDSKMLYGENGRTPNNGGPSDGEDIHNQHNVNLFRELQGLRVSLLSGDIEGVRNSLDTLEEMHSHIIAQRSKIGSRVSGIQNAHRTISRHGITNAQLSSQLEDADMVGVMNNLAKEEVIFRNALQSSKKLIQPTLMDFLR